MPSNVTLYAIWIDQDIHWHIRHSNFAKYRDWMNSYRPYTDETKMIIYVDGRAMIDLSDQKVNHER